MKKLLPVLLLSAGSTVLTTSCTQRYVPPPRIEPAPEEPPAAPPPKNVPRPEPSLISGDLIRITVHQQPDLDLETRIPDAGSISFPLIGAVQAVGKSSTALEQTIREKLAADYLQSPSVTVTVKEFAKRRVFIVGGVTKPDGYEMSHDSRMTVLQLVAAAGGFTERASKDVVQILRRQAGGDRTVLRFSLTEVERALAQGKTEADLDLWPEDLVVVPAAVRVAYVMGQVQRPGAMDLPHNTRMTLSMAVSHAGSYTKFASTGSIQILRHLPSGGTRTLLADLDAILEGKGTDPEILPGDVVWVPERGIF
jgi:polysaccharide biosynthesis/export protein